MAEHNSKKSQLKLIEPPRAINHDQGKHQKRTEDNDDVPHPAILPADHAALRGPRDRRRAIARRI